MSEYLHRMAEYLHRITESFCRTTEYLHRMVESFCKMTDYLHRMAEHFCIVTDNLLIKLHDFLSTSAVHFLTSFGGSYIIKIYTQMLYKRPLYGHTI
jgi:hypothetical protein